MRIVIDRRWRLNAVHEIELPVSASALWGQMKDWMRFICVDPLHADVHLITEQPELQNGNTQGIRMIIRHRLMGIGVDRIGRMLIWREGSAFAFSDLSQRGKHCGFPHVCMYQLEPLNGNRCRLTISARGKWTARFWPRWLIHAWLGWVLWETGACIRRDVNQFSRWLARTR